MPKRRPIVLGFEIACFAPPKPIVLYCCPLKLQSSGTRVCMCMQASKNKNLGWFLLEESALFGNFAATKQTSLPNYGQRYTFGRNPKTGKKKGGIKVHTCIQGNEGVPCGVEFTSAATHDHFMLCPGKLNGSCGALRKCGGAEQQEG